MSGEKERSEHDHDANKEGQNSVGEIVMQQPGEVIAPEVADGLVEKIAEELYGLQTVQCKQLNGYDDKNYHILVSSTSLNPHVKAVCADGYVLKVVNSMDSGRPATLYAQIEVMKHLRRRGIATQEPVPSVDGENVVFYQFPCTTTDETKTYAVCVRTFIPGQILYDVTLTPDLCYKLGKFLASMASALEDFHHPFYDNFDCLWSMNNVPKLTEFLNVITDAKDRCLVDDVIAEFSNTVLLRRNELRAGFVHGDPNEQNILVQSRPGSLGSEELVYDVSGVLDFQDTARTHPVYDLFMLTAYVMLRAKSFDPLEVGGHILAGYTSVLGLPEIERSLLKVGVAARLVQSLVLGAYSHSLDPTNDYLLITAERGWPVLRTLWDKPTDLLYEMWISIEQSHKK